MDNVKKIGIANQMIEIANKMIDKKAKVEELGPGVNMTISETSDGIGFKIKIEGTFRSGNDLKTTVSDIKKFWESLDIDF
jgi:hypothetical protein